MTLRDLIIGSICLHIILLQNFLQALINPTQEFYRCCQYWLV